MNKPHQPRKPTRAEAKAERRQQLIDATIRSIAENGLSGTTIAKVSEIAGTSVGLANFHFETKERLFEATLRYLADDQREFWKARFLDPERPLTDRLTALVDSRFDARVCGRRTLAVWFAFWGDAGARDIYRRVVGDVDDERLDAGVAILTALYAETGQTDADPMETALGMEAFFDGLWLNMLLYPTEFRRLACRDRALDYIAALFPNQPAPTKDQPDAP
ncbi:MAG: TetR family transcriptional regulator C-terminal domain-containing protein [Paracoccaceae bacterium]